MLGNETHNIIDYALNNNMTGAANGFAVAKRALNRQDTLDLEPLSSQGIHYLHEGVLHQVLKPGQLEVRIYLNNTSLNSKPHAAVRYCIPDNSGLGAEYYVSLFPLNDGTCYCCPPVHFNSARGDHETYWPAEPAEGDANDVAITLYQFTGVDTVNLHNKLATFFNDFRPIEPRDEEATYPRYFIPAGEADIYFKMWACISMAPCCTAPLCPSLSGCFIRHNCTSIAVSLLDKAGVSTDLSCKWVWTRNVMQLLHALALSYCTAEASRLLNPSTDTPQPADNIIGTVGAAAGGIGLLTYLFDTFINRISYFDACFGAQQNLTRQGRLSIFTGSISLLIGLTTLAVHFATVSSSSGFDTTEGPFISLLTTFGVFGLLIMGSQLTSCFGDWQNGCSNPTGLDRVLSRAALDSQAPGANIALDPTDYVPAEQAGTGGLGPYMHCCGEDHDREHALFMAAYYSNVDNVRRILRWSRDIDVNRLHVDPRFMDINPDRSKTPLFMAVENGNDAIVKMLLLAKHADRTIAGPDGRTPRQVAVDMYNQHNDRGYANCLYWLNGAQQGGNALEMEQQPHN